MTALLKRSLAFAVLCAVFLIELVKASVDVAVAVFSDTSKLRPAILAVPIELTTDMGIATLANLVSLTPGTTALHVSQDRKTLYIHVLDRKSDEAIIRSIKDTFETRVRAVEPQGPLAPRQDTGAVA